MKSVQYVAGWTDACRLSERARAISAVAPDGHRRARRPAEAIQHTPQLLLLPVRLGRHAAEYDRPALVAADLGNEDLERAYLAATHRSHVAGVDGERDRAGHQPAGFAAAWSRPQGRPPMGRTPPAAPGHGGRAARRPSRQQPAHTPACNGPA